MNNAKLSDVYQATYTIKNPLLNNVEQTITKNYYTNKEGTKIITSTDVE